MELRTRTTGTMHLHGARPLQAVPRRKADIPPTFPKGRICSRPGCWHPLSVYNQGPECNSCWMASLPAEEREAA